MGRAYRSDIDGLRALSVLAVLFFHADFGVPGGFVGVDVFFVISGYLITGLVAAELDAGHFSMARFWERRLRRIWPAALAVTIAALVAGWWLLLPGDYRTLAGDAVAQVAMAANVRYWLGTDYFSSSSDLRPLLHTWSLAVEEQFYVLYPLLLAGLWRFARRHVFTILSCVMFVSLGASILMLGRSASATFYLLPYRAWELQLGGLIALLPPSAAIRGRWSDMVGSVGIAAIVWSCFAYDRFTTFPGVAAIPPCAGAALVLLGCGSERSIVGRLLGSSPLRTIGLMSYSLYLWHWPILAFVRYRWGLELSATSAACSVFASFACAALSYRWIETPFRRGLPGWKLPKVACAAAFASAVPLTASIVIRQSGGVPSRVDKNLAEFASNLSMSREWDLYFRAEGEIFVPIGASQAAGRTACFLFIGDSHGIALSAAVDAVASANNVAGDASLRGAFLPLPGVWRPGAHSPGRDLESHRSFDEQLARELAANGYKHVIVCARWSGYLSDEKTDVGDLFRIAGTTESETSSDGARVAMSSGIRRLLSLVESIDGNLWVLLEVPCQPVSAQRRAIDAMTSGSLSLTGISRDQHLERVHPMRSIIAELESTCGPKLHVVDLSVPFFDSTGVSRVGRAAAAWYVDDDHISPKGADEVLGPVLSVMFRQISEDCASPARATTSAPAP